MFIMKENDVLGKEGNDMKITYNKLVRDHIPEIIDADGKTACCRIMEEEEYRNALKNKLVEEAGEVQAAHSREELVKELADVLEVVEALQDANGISPKEVLSVKHQKAKRNGKFEKRILLECVIEESDD